MVAVTTRLRLELALEQTGTTVTEFLERLTGEPLDARERRHVMTEAGTPNPLELEAGRPLLARSAVLRGRTSGQPYLYGESLLAPSRLPAGFCRDLEKSADPIGRALAMWGIGFTRSRLPAPEPDRPSGFEGLPPPDEYLFSRSYRLLVDGHTAMVIAECFLPALERHLGAL